MLVIWDHRLSARGLVFAIFLVFTGAASAQDAPLDLNIPSQQMRDALAAFSDQTNINFLYAPQLVTGVESQSVRGQFTWREGLEILLGDTNIDFEQSGDNSVSLRRSMSQADQGASGTDMGAAPAAERTPAQANDQGAFISRPKLDELVVTATKRNERLLNVPISITALTNDYLRDAGIYNLDDFVLRVPGLEYTTQQPGRTFINIRGISSLSGAATVGVYFDESPVTFNFFQADFKTIDVDRIEILRGPQGTLFGEGAMGGIIRFITNKPDAEKFDANIEGTYSATSHGGSNYDINGMVNIPIIEDKFALRGVLDYRSDDGYIDNALVSRDDVNDQEAVTGRISGRIFATEDLTLTASLNYHDAEVGANNNANADLINDQNGPEPSEDTYYQANLTIDYELPWFQIVSSTSYFDREFSQTLDLSAFLAFVQAFFDPTVTAIDSNFDIVQEVWSQEIRLVSQTDGRFQWILGGFYKSNDAGTAQPLTIDNILGSGVDANSTADMMRIRQYAIFGEMYFDFTQRLQGTVGLRYFHENFKTMRLESGLFITGMPDGPPVIFEEETSSDELLPKFVLDYQLTDEAMIYASASKGFRSGGTNRGIFVPTESMSFDPDFVWSYEVGTKFSLYDGRLIGTGALFYIDWKDVQIRQAILDPGGSGAVLGQFVANGGKAHSAGVEMELNAQLFEGFDIAVGGNVTDAETDEATTGGGSLIPEGTRLPRVPKWSFNVGAQYRFPLVGSLSGFVRADYQRVGNRFGNEDGTIILPEYGIGNLRAGIESDHWEVVLFANNIGDTLAILDTAPPLSQFRNTPRTVGVTLRARL